MIQLCRFLPLSFKQLQYITKHHIAMHTILFKLKKALLLISLRYNCLYN